MHSNALDLVRFDSSLLKGHAAGHLAPALPHALWASGNSVDKLKAEQRLELRPSDSKPIRSQIPCMEHFLGLAFNKQALKVGMLPMFCWLRLGTRIFFANWVLHHVEKQIFLGGKTSGVT